MTARAVARCRHRYDQAPAVDVTAVFEQDGYTTHPDRQGNWTGRLDHAALVACPDCGQPWLVLTVSGISAGDSVALSEDIAVPIHDRAVGLIRLTMESASAVRLSVLAIV